MRKARLMMSVAAMAVALTGAMIVAPSPAQATKVVSCLSSPDPVTVTRGVGDGQSTCFGGAGQFGWPGGYPDVFQVITGDYSGYIIYEIPGGPDILRNFKPQQTLRWTNPKIHLYTLHIN